ncbi:hypothetical protein FHU36_002996 [Nonomuraea muscovyensis]|uniref:DUF5642 domain-containing protein n=1 Tax=Nonomuraea muscovyensis TaxID=1124761 RepID=A0A7X0EW13_9ACTN|nr:hypothetical protein [Nonomuraea muscovyensis]MBB6346487.1 hypothetical protein [Nonomuraea muscovyensis]
MTLLAGCSSGQAAPAPANPAPASATPSVPGSPGARAASQADTGRLRAALLPAPDGMRVVHGPETGAFGSLQATRQGLEAAKQAKLERPECAGAAQLDATQPALAGAPAAVVAYASGTGSITQALVSLPSPAFPKPLPRQCATYEAQVNGVKVTYRTRELDMPKRGDESRAYLTTASGGADNAQVGSVVLRRGNVVLSLLVVGRKVEPAGLFELGRLADRKLAQAAG